MRALSIFLAIVIAALFALQGWLVFHSQYFEAWQIDRYMHLAAGAVSALVMDIAIFSERSLAGARGLPWWALLLVCVSFAALAGVGWELYEFAWDTFVAAPYSADIAQPNIQDTMEDLIFDLVGALAAGILFVWNVRARHG
ncbi:MAG: hypothetical protein HYS44_02075 [Candidatus Niyogibacteria bacterium]|nr:hypothetical protein [Candidatus Niyogibacteria bacterium]